MATVINVLHTVGWYPESAASLSKLKISLCRMLQPHLHAHPVRPEMPCTCHGTTSFLSFLVFVCPLPHLHHLPTPSALVHLPSATSAPTPRCTRATMLHLRLD